MPEQQQTEEEEWVDIGTYPSLNEAYDHGLVALAMGESIRVEAGEHPGHFDLQAEVESAPKISAEITEYENESKQAALPPIIPSNWAKHPAGVFHVLVWAAILVTVFHFQSQDPTIADRFASSSIALITHGEWWRPFTALFLHGDGPHIVGNLASGTVFGILVAKSIGPLKGWAMILLSGAAGNAITSLITYPEYFSSLGASTAVFGALGILSGTGIIENIREPVRMPWIRVTAPLVAGVILLGWLGGAAPGSNTDVFGHVFGFCAGVVAGVACRCFDKEEPRMDADERGSDSCERGR